ncbi:hypothetical protein [Streptomyces hydrogenans]|uniref:Uncharacterized protein n=1 Tax=Streptomyces hydrogenans TaxID=1873719 RepID=A0ABQ3PJM4_9ACTN|nr:hypothetical protein [Streptomyces hydrogenans]GHG09926.1 hypothetical protein GCM10018784_23220 [Streptomyces hydrogenans]GHI25226.1 hypothetical protein Shyd_65970 [Streptomyces hydrogenans]
MSEQLTAYTVVLDWDSSRGMADAVAFRVWATDPMDARVKADEAASSEYGEDADCLYGVMIFEGHPAACRD